MRKVSPFYLVLYTGGNVSSQKVESFTTRALVSIIEIPGLYGKITSSVTQIFVGCHVTQRIFTVYRIHLICVCYLSRRF